MNAYLNTLTVKTLREIAKRIGFQFISRSRKAELISLILAEIDACHTEAIREDGIRTRQNEVRPYTGSRTITQIKAEGIISRMDYPVPYGRPVTEAHVKICKEFGCVSYVVNGIDQGSCPRCGEVTGEEIERSMIVHFGSLISGIACNATDAQISDKDVSLVTCVECKANVSEEKGMDAIESVIFTAKQAIAALTPSLNAAKTLFESVRDNGGSEEIIGITYQAYCDLYRTIEEYNRTIAYASDMSEHSCELNLLEVGMSGCSYGCKIYRCTKCGSDREMHNATYGCKG